MSEMSIIGEITMLFLKNVKEILNRNSIIETDNIICKECYPNYSYYDDPLKDLYYGDYYDYMPEYIYNFILI